MGTDNEAHAQTDKMKDERYDDEHCPLSKAEEDSRRDKERRVCVREKKKIKVGD